MHRTNTRHRCSPFTRFATFVARVSGRPTTFIVAVLAIVAWALSGPFFHYSDTWQLVVNTTTTIITFLMVFEIQNTQNRDSEAIHLKLDELIRATKAADNALLDLEELEELELDSIRKDYLQLADEARAKPRKVRTFHVSKAEQAGEDTPQA